MPVIEPHFSEPGEGPSVSEDVDPQVAANKCHAELILHKRGQEMFLCREHAKRELVGDIATLAQASIDLALRS